MRLPNAKKPCTDCPFRKGNHFHLGAERAKEILKADSFVCHKNTSLQCGGHMLIKGVENSFVKLASILNLDTGLHGRELVFDTPADCVNHHAKEYV